MDKNKINELIRYFPPGIKDALVNVDEKKWNKLMAIRVNVGGPVVLESTEGKFYLEYNKRKHFVMATQQDISVIFELITNSSAYSYERFINEGYITLNGGNRVGMVGNCVYDNDKIKSVSDIRSFNFRVAHEIIGVSNKVIGFIYNGSEVKNTLIISPPSCGKTTLLRDIARYLGTFCCSGKIIVCAIVDERYEIGGTYSGAPSLCTGENNFLISGCPKKMAVPIITRTMSPDVIIVDEMCDNDDFEAARYAHDSGTKIIATVHGQNENINEMVDKKHLKMFDTIIILSKKFGPSTVEKIITGGM